MERQAVMTDREMRTLSNQELKTLLATYDDIVKAGVSLPGAEDMTKRLRSLQEERRAKFAQREKAIHTAS
jgi:hypothetical protein